MVEKQESFQKDHDWSSEEKNKLFTRDSPWEKKELEKEREIGKMIHKEVTGHDDKKETKSHIDELPSAKLSREAQVCSEHGLANKSRFVIQLTENEDLSQDKSQSKPCKAVNAVALGSLQMKGQTASKPRKKRRPQSLNLGLPPELSYQKGDDDSGEESESSASDCSPDENLATTGNHFLSSAMVLIKDEPGSEENQACKIRKGSKQEDLLSGEGRHVSAQRMEQVKRKESHMESTDIDLDSVNGPEQTIHDGVKGESVVRVRGKGFIDNKELAEVKLRQVRTHERRISSSGGEDMEGFMGDRVQKASLHRLSGSSYQSEITRIVPLKPERLKSVVCKDEKDRTGLDEPAQAFRREYRWSVGSPEGHSDLNWADVPVFHPGFAADMEGNAKAELQDDSYQSGRGSTESQWFSSKGSCLSKMAPPAPPVKTQKARESGLILRNSRNAGRDPSLEAAKKRHSVTAWLLLFSHWKIKHRMSFRQTRTPFPFFFFFSCVFSDLKTVIHHTCLNRQGHIFAPPVGQNSFQSLDNVPDGKSAQLIPQKQKTNINMTHSG